MFINCCGKNLSIKVIKPMRVITTSAKKRNSIRCFCYYHNTIFYYFSNLIYNFILENYPSFANTCIVLDPIRSLEYIIDTKKSLSRFGDGEINMAKGYDIHYEKHDKFTEIFIEI